MTFLEAYLAFFFNPAIIMMKIMNGVDKMLTESDIVHSTKDFWVLKVPTGKNKGTYEVYKNGVTHSTRCAIIGYKGHDGLEKAISECNKRQADLDV